MTHKPKIVNESLVIGLKVYILIIINFEPYPMQGTQINIFVQRGHDKNTWKLGNLGNSLSNSLVTV